MTDKSENAYKTIGEVAEILELKSKTKGVFSTHTIRFWETQFKQIKPKLLNSNRRYYDKKTIDVYIKPVDKEDIITNNIIYTQGEITIDLTNNISIIDSKLKDLGYCGTREIINEKFWVPQNR